MKNLSPQTKQIIISAFVLILIIWFIKRQLANTEQTDIETKSDNEGAPKPSTSIASSKPSWQKKYDALPSVGDDGLLKRGVKAQEVWKLQYLYNENIAKKEGKSKIAVDGVFGSGTEAAVKYVYEGKYSQVRLGYFRKFVIKTKAQRVAALNPSYGLTSSALENTTTNPSLSTYVNQSVYNNPYL